MYFKFMRITTLTTLLLFTGFLTLFAYRGASQPLNSVRISLDLHHVSLKKSLSVIEDKTIFKFIYNAQEIGNQKDVSLTVSDQPLDKVLDELLEKRNLSYKNAGTNILIKTKA